MDVSCECTCVGSASQAMCSAAVSRAEAVWPTLATIIRGCSCVDAKSRMTSAGALATLCDGVLTSADVRWPFLAA